MREPPESIRGIATRHLGLVTLNGEARLAHQLAKTPEYLLFPGLTARRARHAPPEGSGTHDPYRGRRWVMGAGGRSAGDRGSSRTPGRGDACVAQPRRQARGSNRGTTAPGRTPLTPGSLTLATPVHVSPCRGDACLAQPRRTARGLTAAVFARVQTPLTPAAVAAPPLPHRAGEGVGG